MIVDTGGAWLAKKNSFWASNNNEVMLTHSTNLASPEKRQHKNTCHQSEIR